MIRNKKAVAPVIATVLLIVIVVIAVALVIVFVIPMMRESMIKSKACSEARLEIEYACYDSSTNSLKIKISRGSEEFNLTSVVVQAINSTVTNTRQVSVSIGPFGSEVKELVSPVTNPSGVGIASVVKVPERASTITCDIISVVPVSPECPS
ncbi:MAG: type IV pilin [Candidatus Pacearchaeota archaeon]